MGGWTREIAERYKLWLESDVFDEETKKELRGLEGKDAEITDRFYRDESLYSEKSHSGTCQLYSETGSE